MRRVALLAVLLAALLVPATGIAQAQSAPATPDTQIHVTIQEDGDARWAVTARFPLETQNDTAAFETLRAEFAAGATDGYLSVDPFREAANRVSDRAGESMSITQVDRTADVRTINGTDVGRLTLSFTWTNFATIDEEAEEVRVGTAFEGGWFGDLGPRQTLLIEPPAGYTVHTVEPLQAISNGTLRWDGPQAFGPGQPVVTFEPVPPGPLPVSIPITASVGLGVGVLIGILALVAWRRDWFTGGRETAEDEVDTDTAPESTAERRAEPAAEPTPAPRSGDDTEPTASESEQASETELLSDEERVERLLREHGGRMKQARIVEETRWSNAKVSQLLSSMAEEGRVEKLRLGRENLISLPDEES
jgi:uncharacterized membrane protein